MYIVNFSNSRKTWRKLTLVSMYRHRTKGPAIEWDDGDVEWWFDGRRHRDNCLPAVIYADGSCEYWENGIPYKIVEYENGTKEWHYDRHHGICLHKRNGPAVIYSNGDQEYWEWGKLHRNNGPAAIYGNKQYWFHYGEFVKMETI